MYFDDPNKTYIILDIEGNSASKVEERRITQFSGLIIKNHQISEVNLLNRNVNSINTYVTKLTKISVHKCKDLGVSEKHLIKEIYNLLSSCDMIYAYGCNFDKDILKIMFKKYHYPFLNIPWFDVIEDVKKYLCPSKNKLSIAASEYGFTCLDYHNALTDCYATLHLMKVIMNLKEQVKV